MASFPAVEQLTSALVLRDLKAAIATITKERTELLAMKVEALELASQNERFGREIDGARAGIFLLIQEQLKSREAAHAEEYLALLETALEPLTGKDKTKSKEKP
jgi:hypothetical protein